MKNLSTQKSRKLNTKQRKVWQVCVICVLAISFVVLSSLTAFAAGDELTTTLNNFVDLLFSVIRIVGFVMAAWGIIQLIMSLQAHDPSQRVNGVFFLAGGLIIFFSREILTAIGVTI